jgi:hypothetical protein
MTVPYAGSIFFRTPASASRTQTAPSPTVTSEGKPDVATTRRTLRASGSTAASFPASSPPIQTVPAPAASRDKPSVPVLCHLLEARRVELALLHGQAVTGWRRLQPL